MLSRVHSPILARTTGKEPASNTLKRAMPTTQKIPFFTTEDTESTEKQIFFYSLCALCVLCGLISSRNLRVLFFMTDVEE